MFPVTVGGSIKTKAESDKLTDIPKDDQEVTAGKHNCRMCFGSVLFQLLNFCAESWQVTASGPDLACYLFCK
jgi:hypothetical protein